MNTLNPIGPALNLARNTFAEAAMQRAREEHRDGSSRYRACMIHNAGDEADVQFDQAVTFFRAVMAKFDPAGNHADPIGYAQDELGMHLHDEEGLEFFEALDLAEAVANAVEEDIRAEIAEEDLVNEIGRAA
jgi:hypothetical protein